MKASKTLTDSAVKAAKPKDKPYKLSDMNRLYLLVSTAGGKSWKWNYRLDGKDCTYTIGTYPGVSLSEAREKRIAIAKLVQQGIHPVDHEEEQRRKARAEKVAIFWVVAEEWIALNKVNWSPAYLRQVEVYLERYAGPKTEFGQRPIRQITAPEITQLVTSVANRTGCAEGERKATGAPALAINLRLWCSAVFRRAIATGKADRNPVADLKTSDVIVRPKVKNNLALKPSQLQGLIKVLDGFTGQRTTAIAIELIMLTFVRTVELRAATWDEFDFDKAEWIIPASRMKMKGAGDHLVPLSAQAIALLKELRDITGAAKAEPRWLFPNLRREADCMSATTINRALERMGFSGKDSIGFSAHGFRGTASTLLNEQGFRSKVIEVQLAHKKKNAVAAVYDKAVYLPERIVMMQHWSDYLEGLKA